MKHKKQPPTQQVRNIMRDIEDNFYANEAKKKKIQEGNDVKRRKLDQRYASLSKMTLREIEKRNLEFNDDNITLILNILLETKYFATRFNFKNGDDNMQEMINAVKRVYNANKRAEVENNSKNGETNDSNETR